MSYKKYWQKPRLYVSVALLTLTACAPSKTVVSAQLQPLPAVLTLPCQVPPTLRDNKADTVLLALKAMYDLYGDCAGKHVELINYLQNKK